MLHIYLFLKKIFFNPISYVPSDSVAPTGGASEDIKEGVISVPMLIPVKIMIHMQNIGPKDKKIFARFHDFKIL